MSEKKGNLKQMRLPFQIISTSPKTTTPISSIATSPASVEKPSPKTPKNNVSSRKRKPSNEGENVRSSKIGRTNSKENIIAEADPIEIADSNDSTDVIAIPTTAITTTTSNNDTKQAQNETTPVTETIVHIKLPSNSKSKRKINMDVKQPKSIDEEDPDDSIVYLDEEELPKKSKKSVKKSEKKKKAQPAMKDEKSETSENHAKKNLQLNEPIETPIAVPVDVAVLEEKEDKPIIVFVDNQKKSEDKKLESSGAAENKDRLDNVMSSELSKLVNSGNTSVTEDQIMDMLSDDADKSLCDDRKSPTSDALKAVKSAALKLTPKALERRKELEAKRLEKEQLRQKERDEKEKQRLKEKEMREEAKRKEKEEKEEQRKREKEDREVIKKFVN
jgi:hypothetical protein